MTSERTTAPTEIVDALRARMRRGQGLSKSYARQWEVGGCSAIHSLRRNPYDGLLVLAVGLSELGEPVVASTDRLTVEAAGQIFWVAANRSTRGDGPPDAYLVGVEDEHTARFVGNAAEVVVEIVRGMSTIAGASPVEPEIQVGFPGLQDSAHTYVGSWQWNVHGEARDGEFVRRAANATLKAIDATKEQNAGHTG